MSTYLAVPEETDREAEESWNRWIDSLTAAGYFPMESPIEVTENSMTFVLRRIESNLMTRIGATPGLTPELIPEGALL